MDSQLLGIQELWLLGRRDHISWCEGSDTETFPPNFAV